ENKELADLSLWDKAWNKQWNEVWKEFGPTTQLRNSGGIQAIAGITGGMTISVNGHAPCRAAGRAPVKLNLSQTSDDMLSAVLDGTSAKLRKSFIHDPKGKGPQGKKNPESKDPSGTESLESHTHQATTSSPNNPPLAKKLNNGISWLGNSCALSGSDKHEVWATPQESAVEVAWAAAWPVAERLGRKAVTSVPNPGEKITRNTQPPRASVRPRALTTVHPSVVGLTNATKAVGSFAVKTSRTIRSSLGRDLQVLSNDTPNMLNTPNTPILTNRRSQAIGKPNRMSREVTAPIRESGRTGVTSLPTSATPRPRKSSISETSKKQIDTATPDIGLHSITEVPSQIHLPAALQTVPSVSIRATPNRAASEPFPVGESEKTTAKRNSDPISRPSSVATIRQRSESAKKLLRRHVIPRLSDAQRDSQLEDAFLGKTKEKLYREKKDYAMLQAKKEASESQFAQEQLSKVNPIVQAEQAWERVVAISGREYFMQNLNILAQHKWDELVERCKKTPFLAPVGDRSSWQTRFAEIWEKAWKESWAAAWNNVWSQAFDEATSRGIEFGIEDALDLVPGMKRRTYEQLRSSESYDKLKELLGGKSASEILEQVHQWMKELGYLSESLRYSVPTLRDDCMEIIASNNVKLKATSALAASIGITEVRPKPVRMSHFELQRWLANEYIPQRVHNHEQVHRLFLRGIAEVWDTISDIS
ncbi:unnamed protein product, partial [Rhizoctonia solani]